MPTVPKSLASTVQTLASQCVRCGLCLPKCPTYQLERNEANSPRGRIALLAGLAEGQLEIDTTFQQAIDQCLSCRACESVCPAHVPYEELLIQGRALQQYFQPKALAWPWRVWLKSQAWRQALLFLARVGQRSGLGFLAKRLKLDRYWSYLPTNWPKAQPLQSFYPALSACRGQVGLLLGCSAESLEPDTVQAAIHLLRHCGFDVVIPKNQACCGAVHRHHGLLAQADALMKHQSQLCHQTPTVSAWLSLATGCFSTWQKYPLPVWDIQRFLVDHWLDSLPLQAYPVHVAIHEACSQRNSLKDSSVSWQLLQKIPGLQRHPWTAPTCCGAAGDYFIHQPRLSDQLAQMATDHLPAVEVVVSANIGCRLQLAKHSPNKAIRFMHPITLLAQALQD